ncbi:MAG: FIST C-terminal domain-containing protein, partial [Deltaproteobacteria bacterium]|nr:FIST C-terminal domain-containing protein [Deltaproteobacteria bacterium]
MLRAGVGQSANSVTEQAAREAAAQAMTQGGIAEADLVLVFFTVDHLDDSQKLLSVTRAITQTETIVGSSGAGVLSRDGEIEGAPGIAVLVLSSEDLRAHPLWFNPLKGRDHEMGREIARAVKIEPERESLLVLFPDPYNAQPSRLFEGIEEGLGSLPVVGAGSSENGSRGKTYQLFGDKITSNSISGFWLNGPFQSSIDITQGCQPITEPMVITKAQGNLILELDHRPAFEVFAKVIKGPLLEDIGRALAFVFAGLPADRRQNSVAPGQYLVRNIVGLDPQKGVLAVGEQVFEGEQMVFTLRDSQRAREDLQQMLARQRQSLGGMPPRLWRWRASICCRSSRAL